MDSSVLSWVRNVDMRDLVHCIGNVFTDAGLAPALPECMTRIETHACVGLFEEGREVVPQRVEAGREVFHTEFDTVVIGDLS